MTSVIRVLTTALLLSMTGAAFASALPVASRAPANIAVVYLQDQ